MYSVFLTFFFSPQNIDTLERVAGIQFDKLVEAHGSFYTSHCLDCSKVYEQDWMKSKWVTLFFFLEYN